MIPLIPVNKRTMSMSENKTTSETSDHHETDVELENMNDLPEPQEKKNRWKPLLIWIIPLIALLIALSLAVKALLSNGPTIEVSFRTAEGLVAGKTTVRYKQVDIGWYGKSILQKTDLILLRALIYVRMQAILLLKIHGSG